MIGSWAGTKVTCAPVRFSNSSRTFSKFFCSAPVQTAATSRLSPSSWGRVTVAAVSLPPSPCPLSPPPSSSPPHAVSERARAPAARKAAALVVFLAVPFPALLTVLPVRMVLLVRITAPFFVLVERSALSRALWCTPGG